MIIPSDFLKWCEVFHVATGGNPPTTVSLQVAYNNSSPKDINLLTNQGIYLLQDADTLSLGNSAVSRPNAVFQIDSTVNGVLPFPRMSLAQEGDLGTILTSSDAGMYVYNTDFQSLDQWDGTQFLNTLTVGKVLPGANVSIINNGDGTIAIAATSGPSAVTSGQCNFFITSNAMPTVFGASFTAVPILSDNLHILNETNFNATLIGDTPNANFLIAATRQCLINADFTVRTSSLLTQTYTLYLTIAGTPTITTGPIGSITVDPSGAAGPQQISLTYNLALTGPSESIQFWISNDSATADPVIITYAAVTILDTTQFNGFNSTDNLPQGALNWYLSQDGGTTFQNVTGLPVVVGHVPTFSTVGGKLSDSGLALSDFIKQGDSGIFFGISPTAPLVSTNMLNLYSTGIVGDNSQNWYNDTDNYPLFQISPLDHDNINLNFDCYQDGPFFRASTNAIAWQIKKNGGLLNFLWGTATQGNILGSMNNVMEIDAAGRITIPYGSSLETLRLGTSSTGLTNTTPAISFSTSYGTGNLLNLEGSGRNIGVYANTLFATYNLNYNNSIPGYQVVTTGDVFAVEISSGGIALKYQQNPTGGTTASLNTSLLVRNDGFIALPFLPSGSTLLSVDSGKVINNATGFFTLSGLTFNNGNGPLLGTAAVVNFDPVLEDGDYINLAGAGRNIGVTAAGRAFLSYNLDWDGAANTYKFNDSGNAFTIEIGSSGIFFKSATSGSSGVPVIPAVGFQMGAAGAVDIPFVTDNSLVARVSGLITTGIGGSFSLGQLMLNSITAPSLIQAGRLNLVGQNTTTDNALNLYVHTDGYPLVNMVGTAHGTERLNFDCYFDGTNDRSSYSSGSNYQFIKSSDLFTLNCKGSVAQGSTIAWNTAWRVDTSGNFQVQQVSASSLVVTDVSGNFRSSNNLIITSDVTVTGSTQTAANNTRYYINYSGGQCVVTLPAALANGGPIEVVGLSTASTSGWKVVAVGSDVIQFGSSVSAGAGNIVSTTGSATDAITLRPIAGKWIVYPALGLNLVVT